LSKLYSAEKIRGSQALEVAQAIRSVESTLKASKYETLRNAKQAANQRSITKARAHQPPPDPISGFSPGAKLMLEEVPVRDRRRLVTSIEYIDTRFHTHLMPETIPHEVQRPKNTDFDARTAAKQAMDSDELAQMEASTRLSEMRIRNDERGKQAFRKLAMSHEKEQMEKALVLISVRDRERRKFAMGDYVNRRNVLKVDMNEETLEKAFDEQFGNLMRQAQKKILDHPVGDPLDKVCENELSQTFPTPCLHDESNSTYRGSKLFHESRSGTQGPSPHEGTCPTSTTLLQDKDMLIQTVELNQVGAGTFRINEETQNIDKSNLHNVGQPTFDSMPDSLTKNGLLPSPKFEATTPLPPIILDDDVSDINADSLPVISSGSTSMFTGLSAPTAQVSSNSQRSKGGSLTTLLSSWHTDTMDEMINGLGSLLSESTSENSPTSQVSPTFSTSQRLPFVDI
jgi:hypothetical protein